MEKPSTTTIILVVGILAIVLVLYMNSGTKPVKPAAQAGGTSTLAGLFSLATPLINAAGKIVAPSSLPQSSAYFGQGDSMSQAGYGLSHGVVEQEGNQLIDLNTGNALVFGAE